MANRLTLQDRLLYTEIDIVFACCNTKQQGFLWIVSGITAVVPPVLQGN